MQVNGICPYCGQMKILEVPDNYTQQDILRAAVMSCDCNEAQGVREQIREQEEREESTKEAKTNVRSFFGRDLPEVARVLQGAVDSIAEGAYDQITITKGKTKGTVKRNKDKITVKRVDTNEQTMESDI